MISDEIIMQQNNYGLIGGSFLTAGEIKEYNV
jgi:hypothetical protein